MVALRVSADKVQLFMARRCMNPYELCSRSGISYTSYRRIMNTGGCKVATLGKLAIALQCDITDILSEQKNE